MNTLDLPPLIRIQWQGRYGVVNVQLTQNSNKLTLDNAIHQLTTQFISNVLLNSAPHRGPWDL